MKSKRAKEALRVLPLNKANVEYCLEKGVINGSLKVGIENIVCLAEQDADERYYNAVKLLLQEVRDAIKKGNSADDVLFSSLARYNCILNGGNNNE